MSLYIPTEFLAEINKYSGYFNPTSYLSKKTLKGLFMSPPNQTYLGEGVYKLIINEKHVNNTLGLSPGSRQVSALITLFNGKKSFIQQSIHELMEAVTLPYREDITSSNPVQQLHAVNKDFLISTSRNMIISPESLIPNFYSLNLETGKHEELEWEYGPESYSDGSWHPEHLFTSCKRNRETPYWNTGPESSGRHLIRRMDGGRKYFNKETGHQFPRWQITLNHRAIDWDNKDTYREAGDSDRRVQRNRGYNMAALLSKN